MHPLKNKNVCEGIGVRTKAGIIIICIDLIIPYSYYTDPPNINETIKLLDDKAFIDAPALSVVDLMSSAIA
jgi:hypothetical protein